MEIRNIAIIAHVDHGKTTLVDALLKAGGAFAAHQQVEERVMDSNDQEKERGITIYAKNATIFYKNTKINLVDTPGHADFGSEVERILRMVDGALLLVDASEGPMPQTKFVLAKALALGMPILIVVNKIDKPNSRPDEVIDLTFDLMASLGASNEQLDFPYLYTIARDGIAIQNIEENIEDQKKDISLLLDMILEHLPNAVKNTDADLRLQPSTLVYNNFLGRMGVGRIYEGTITTGQTVTVFSREGLQREAKISKIFSFKGLERVEIDSASSGDIVAFAGISDIYVGETVTNNPKIEPLPLINVEPPALAMTFMINDSPFAGQEGQYVTSRHLKERLLKELETNVGLKLQFDNNADTFKVMGRGEMHLAVLIESMRREGFELQVSQPEVVFQMIDGKEHEPLEYVVVSVPEEKGGKVIEALSLRKGDMLSMDTINQTTTLEFHVPTRGLLGFRSEFIILTRGEGTIYHSFEKYVPYMGPIEKRKAGSMISGDNGETTAFALWNLQERGPLFIHPGLRVYEGMIIGEHNKGSDLTVNPLKEKKLTNVRAAGSDEAIKLTPPIPMTLERAIEYIQEDEYVEVTPKNIRLRKRYLNELDRKRKGRR